MRDTLLMIAATALTVFAGVAIYAMARLLNATRSAERLLTDLESTLPDLMRKADATLDSADARLREIDDMLVVVRQASDALGAVTATLQDLVGGAVGSAGRAALRMRSLLHGIRGQRHAGGAADDKD